MGHNLTQVSAILRKTATGYCWWCPGCQECHAVNTENEQRPFWLFNGDVERPTFSPSVRHFIPARPAREGRAERHETTFCHYFVESGQIRFLNDCDHALKGQTVPMVDLSTIGDYGWP